MSSKDQEHGTSVRGARILLAAALVLMVAIRFYRLDMPLERDEGEYAYGGQLVLAGEFSYETLRTLKLPGMHVVSATAFALLGETKQALHIALLLASVASTVFTFLAARKLWTEWFAATAAATVAIFGLSQTLLGLAAHAEPFALAFVGAGTWLLLVALESRRIAVWIASGLCFGLAFLMKQPALVFAALALGCVVVTKRREAGPLRIGLWSLSLVLPLAFVCVWMAGIGRFEAFWTSTVIYASSYVTDTSLELGMTLLSEQMRAFDHFQRALVVLAGLSFIGLALVPNRAGRRVLVALVLVAGLLAASPGLYFRGHYFVLALGGIGVLVATGCELLARFTRRSLATALLILALLAGVARENRYLFSEPADLTTASVYHPNPTVEAEAIARFVRERTEPSDTIAVLGSEPAIPFLAQRRSATGFVYMYPLMEVHALAREMQEQAIRELEAADPRMLVLVNVSMSWLQKSASEKLLLEWFARTSRSKYRVAAVCDLVEPGRPLWIEGPEAASYRPTSKNYATVFERRP